MATLPPLRFVPHFTSNIWGGHRLREWLDSPPAADPTGEAWVLSDVKGSPGHLPHAIEGMHTLRDLVENVPGRLLGRSALSNGRFPVLLKFLDAAEPLSVQVHPSNERARRLQPDGPGLGKTEAWVVLHADPGAKLYAGLKAGVTQHDFEVALRRGNVPDLLHTFTPHPGDCVFLNAGTVHAIGAGLKLFEIQQTSDITYRLSDWGRVDPKSGLPRELHVAEAFACTDYGAGPCAPVVERAPLPGTTQHLVDCPYFSLDRHYPIEDTTFGVEGECRVLVCLRNRGVLCWQGQKFPVTPGSVWVIPAETGPVQLQVRGDTMTVLECTLPAA